MNQKQITKTRVGIIQYMISKDYTLDEIGQVLGISKQRVSQILKAFDRQTLDKIKE